MSRGSIYEPGARAIGRGFYRPGPNRIGGTSGVLGGAGIPFPQPNAIIDEKFFTQQFFPRAYSSEFVDTRSSAQLVPDATGAWTSFSSTVLPISNNFLEVEPAATNLFLQSVDLTNTAWSAVLTTITGGQAAPDGSTSAALLIPSTANAGHNVFNHIGLTATAAQYVQSVFMKPAGYNFGFVSFGSPNGVSFTGIVDLRTGAVTKTNAVGSPSGAAISAQAYSNGWCRVSLTMTASATASQTFMNFGSSNLGTTNILGNNVPGFVGDGTSGVLAWAPQLELGSVATSPIATTAAAATRSANAITIQRTGIGRIVYTFDDGSQQTISGISTGSNYTLTTNLNRPLIQRMTGYAS